MGKHKIRHKKTCLNCGAFVETHYCPKCGQENSESRQSFHHLFTHFVFDFIHYDSSFWRTVKYLFLSPGKLSIEYMNGKRKSYVNPFTLYIFISFITFFIPSVLPDASKSNKNILVEAEVDEAMKLRDSLIATDPQGKLTAEKIDAKYKALPQEKQFLSPDGIMYKTGLAIVENSKDKQKNKEAIEFLIHNMPKVLFIYMPIFAFWLWLFHNKRKRFYFDSGVFTLHFFSVVLLSITICNIFTCLFDWIGTEWPTGLLWTFMIFYITFYFFRGCRRFYDENRFISNLKSGILVLINSFMIILITTLYAILGIYMVFVHHH